MNYKNHSNDKLLELLFNKGEIHQSNVTLLKVTLNATSSHIEFIKQTIVRNRVRKNAISDEILSRMKNDK